MHDYGPIESARGQLSRERRLINLTNTRQEWIVWVGPTTSDVKTERTPLAAVRKGAEQSEAPVSIYVVVSTDERGRQSRGNAIEVPASHGVEVSAPAAQRITASAASAERSEVLVRCKPQLGGASWTVMRLLTAPAWSVVTNSMKRVGNL